MATCWSACTDLMLVPGERRDGPNGAVRGWDLPRIEESWPFQLSGLMVSRDADRTDAEVQSRERQSVVRASALGRHLVSVRNVENGDLALLLGQWGDCF